MSVQTQLHTVDYLFAGAGASATLLLMSMEQRGLLQGKSIVVLDPDSKTNNDKTYCFWGKPNELPASKCNHLISYEWDKVSVNQKESELLFPMKYFHISSIDLYHELQRIIHQHGLYRVQASVIEMVATQNGVHVKSDKGDWKANKVFDSRPPKYLPPNKNEAHLFQSFIGFVVDLETKVPDSSTVDLMDFEVEQQGFTQFMYVLPMNSNKMLVELTRFGEVAITKTEAEPILHQYIAKRFGRFKIINTETGCIPMSTAKIDDNSLQGVISIGGRAGAVKPSTGYAFKNMFIHAEKLADSLQNGVDCSEKFSSSRFKFYDRLLLLILSKQPSEGKPIFLSLFQKNKALDVLQFLDQKTTLYQDFRILITLPFKPFLKALWQDIGINYKNLFAPVLLLLFTLFLWALQLVAPSMFVWVTSIFLLLGLLCVGIPHGALDHILENGNLESKVELSFVLNYLGASAIYLILWLIFPNIALFLFLVYSIWHFGQSDMEEWQLQNKMFIKNWAWGSLVFGIVLFGHVVETNLILESMGVFTLPFSYLEGKMFSGFFLVLAIVWAIFERKPAMLLSSIMLAIGIQLPLITSFGLYFIGQHSINGWSHIKRGLNTNNTSLYMKALPFTAMAVFFFLTALAWYFFQNDWFNEFKWQLLSIFFVFISCISFPHVFMMNKFYKKYLAK